MIFLALGSNLSSKFGDRFKNIDIAANYLEKFSVKILSKSSYYETPSYPDKKNPKFINIVIKVSTNLSVQKLAKIIIKIEGLLERKRINKNDPRTCDIDIIDFDKQILNFKLGELNFIIPHEKISNRNFVLFPIKEISPDWSHPKTKESINKVIFSYFLTRNIRIISIAERK